MRTLIDRVVQVLTDDLGSAATFGGDDSHGELRLRGVRFGRNPSRVMRTERRNFQVAVTP
jgi:hypothetical protein